MDNETPTPTPIPFKQSPDQTPANQQGPKASPPVVFQNNATVEWLDQDGKVLTAGTVPRSTAELLRYMNDCIQQDKTLLDRSIKITVQAEPGQPRDEHGQEYVIKTEGPVREVGKKLIGSTVSPQLMALEFQKLSMFAADHSSLKGVMVTFVFGDAEAGGFGFLSTTSTVTNTDVVTLVESAKSQVDLFVNKVKATHPDIVFPSESRILRPDGRLA